MNDDVAYGQTTLPAGIRSRFVSNVNGLVVHLLEAGHEDGDRPCVLLLHGFPELAYSWRKVMLPLAEAGFHVVAPDQRGYGRTTGWDGSYDGDLGSYCLLNLVRDTVGLVARLGYRSVAAVVGHDFGSHVAGWCALLRPDIFRAAVMMSAPFEGPPALPGRADDEPPPASASQRIHEELAALPRPRKHYQWYFGTREANDNMRNAPQGIHTFLRAYFHYKSADWKGNKPHPLAAWSAEELAKLPTYYVMDLDKGMAETVAPEMPSAEEIAACRWLPEEELAVYSAEFARTGFQGGLQWYRARVDARCVTMMQTFAGLTVDVPSAFIAGASDWGVHQRAGAFEKMQKTACTRMQDVRLVEGAGHWVQQEKPEEVSQLLVQFLRR